MNVNQNGGRPARRGLGENKKSPYEGTFKDEGLMKVYP